MTPVGRGPIKRPVGFTDGSSDIPLLDFAAISAAIAFRIVLSASACWLLVKSSSPLTARKKRRARSSGEGTGNWPYGSRTLARRALSAPAVRSQNSGPFLLIVLRNSVQPRGRG